MGREMAPLAAQPCIWEAEESHFVGHVGRGRVAAEESDEGMAVVS